MLSVSAHPRYVMDRTWRAAEGAATRSVQGTLNFFNSGTDEAANARGRQIGNNGVDASPDVAGSRPGAVGRAIGLNRVQCLVGGHSSACGLKSDHAVPDLMPEPKSGDGGVG